MSGTLSERTIGGLAPDLQARRVSPVELLRDVLDRIQRVEPRLKTFITLRTEEAMEAARTAEREIQGGHYRGPLHGIPIALKDNIAATGWPTTNGSRIAAQHVTDFDATVTVRLREAGAVIVGKNNMHEWALGGTSWGGAFGSVQNPWAPGCIAGGSSGGSAAAVSASLVFAAVGTDGMGSIRIPASLCGVVGLKPTYGLVSRWGELPPTSSQMDHLGPLAKCVRDAAFMLNAIAGFDPRDPTARRLPVPDYTAGLDRSIAGLRVGVPTSYFFDDTNAEVRASVESSIELLASLGASIHRVEVPLAAYAYKAFALMPPETLSFHRAYIGTRRHEYADVEIGRRLVALQFVLSRHTQLAMQVRNMVRHELQQTMQGVDVLVAPTVPVPTFPGDAEAVSAGGDSVALQRPLGQHRLLTRLTVPFNFTGMPAISVPCGFTSDGLPIGLQIAGRRQDDALVLNVAYAFERGRGIGYAVPPV